MSKANTTPQKLDSKKYISFSFGNTYSIDTESMIIAPVDFTSIIDIQQFGTELSVDGYEYSVLAVHKVDYESGIFKKNITKAHTINHYSHDISIYRNKHQRAYCIRLAVEDEIILVELM